MFGSDDARRGQRAATGRSANGLLSVHLDEILGMIGADDVTGTVIE